MPGREPATALLYGTLPLVAVATDTGHAAGLALALVVAATLAVVLQAALRRGVGGDTGWPAFAFVAAAATGIAELVVAAWAQPLYRPIAWALPLVLANAAWLAQCRQAPGLQAWRDAALCALLVLVIGLLRDAPLAGLANVVATPAGAFVVLALVLAARRATAQESAHA